MNSPTRTTAVLITRELQRHSRDQYGAEHTHTHTHTHMALEAQISALEKQYQHLLKLSVKSSNQCHARYAGIKLLIKKHNRKHEYTTTMTTATVLQECYHLNEQVQSIKHHVELLQAGLLPRPLTILKLPSLKQNK